MVFWLHENQVIKRGKNDIIKIEKRGRILRIILKKRGKRDIVKKGGRNRGIERTPLS